MTLPMTFGISRFWGLLLLKGPNLLEHITFGEPKVLFKAGTIKLFSLNKRKKCVN